MYFTSDMRYSSTYAREHDAKGYPGVKVFLMAMVLPGNYFPATEHPFVVPFEQDPSIEGDAESSRPAGTGVQGRVSISLLCDRHQDLLCPLSDAV